MMPEEDKQVTLTAAWLFMQHGQTAKAKAICRAVNEDDPGDGVCAALLAQLHLDDGEPEAALATLRQASIPAELERAAAVLETRALRELGRAEESRRRWEAYVVSHRANGARRDWVVAR